MLTFRITLAALFLLPAGVFSQAVPTYVDVAFIKSKSPDFLAMEKEQWVPVHKQLIREGRKVAWYLYRVKYPTGTAKEYDFVRFNVFTDWKQVEAPYSGLNDIIKKVYPSVDPSEFTKKNSQSREVAWTTLYQVLSEAAVKITEPSKYIIVNQMKTVPGGENQYVKLELTYFKPFHVERVARGLMNNWGLYKPSLPYGTKYDHDYMTLNGFNTWEDITRNNPPDLWTKVHGALNFDEIHTKILEKRTTVNNEIWELVAFAVQ